mmetsp:Transcript_3938/g.13654  ORF Transcript_3938/g.13654 Transcript_3938/m.13654 type:complete len:276 (-) Transcript_3938:172-999(-)
MTVFDGLNGDSIPPAVVTASFLLLPTLLNTIRFTRARSWPFAFIGIITSVNSAFPVTSWNSRLKSPSSNDSGTTTDSHDASANFVSTHAARWSVSTKTASKLGGRSSSALASRAPARCHASPLRVHSGARSVVSIASTNSSSSAAASAASSFVSCVSVQDTAPAEGIRYKFGGIAGLCAAGRIMYFWRSISRRDDAAAAGDGFEKNAPKTEPFVFFFIPARASSSSASIASSRSRMSPSARVSAVVFSTVTCRPFIGAPNPSRALPPRRSAVTSL